MKKKETTANALNLTTDELIAKVSRQKNMLSKKVILMSLLAVCTVVPVLGLVLKTHETKIVQLDDIDNVSLVSAPIAAATGKKDLISIPVGTVKANPFLPYRDIGDVPVVSDVPGYDLVEPPEIINEGSDAARVMDTVVSGILFDKYSPSAILNIEGNDYLVKKGDVVNNYKVVSILQDSVTVKLGSNTFKAGIGEILTEGSLNHNDVSNLSKKFGGERR